MKFSTFKKILPVLRQIAAPGYKKPNDRTIDFTRASEEFGDYLVISAQDGITDLEIKALGVETSNYEVCVNFAKFNKLMGSIKDMPSFDYEAGDAGFPKMGSMPAGLKLAFGKRMVKLDSAKLQRMDYGKREFKSIGEGGIQFDVPRLVQGLEYIAPAISNDQTRFHLNGVLFAPNGDLVSTDGHRLHVYNYVNDGGETPQFFVSGGMALNKACEPIRVDTILPQQHVKMLLAAIKATGGGMVYACHGTQDGSRHLQFIVDGNGLSFKITAKLIESNFPPYHNVIPKKHEARAIVNAAEFSEAAALVHKMLDSETRGVEFRLNGRLHLRGGGVSESIEAPYTGEGFEYGEIGCNGSYIVDAASKLPGENCTVEFGKALEPITITQKGGFLAVVMPMRV